MSGSPKFNQLRTRKNDGAPVVFIEPMHSALDRRGGPVLGSRQTADAVYALFTTAGWVARMPARDELNWGQHQYSSHAVQALYARHAATCDLIVSLGDTDEEWMATLAPAAERGVPILSCTHEAEEFDTSGVLGRRVALNDRLPNGGEHLVIEISEPSEITARVEALLGPSSADASHSSMRALLDIGSNSIKFAIYSVQRGRSPLVIAGTSRRESMSIADGVRETGSVASEKILQLEQLLDSYRDLASEHNASPIIIATEAIRQAHNRAAVGDLVQERLGAQLQIMTQEAEAEAIASAIIATLDPHGSAGVLNLGGSSVQLIADVGTARSCSYLLRFGTKDVIARLPWTEPMSRERWNAVRDFVRSHLDSAGITKQSARHLFHTGGELDFLLRCDAPMIPSLLSPQHVSMIPVEEFIKFAEEFSATSPESIAARTGLQGAWLAGSVASNAIAIESAVALGAEYLVPSQLNVTDGVVLM